MAPLLWLLLYEYPLVNIICSILTFRPLPYTPSHQRHWAISASSVLQVLEQTPLRLSYVCTANPAITWTGLNWTELTWTELTRTPDIIDKTSYEVKREDDDNIIDSIEELVDGLPDNSPRFVVLSYPITEADGRMKSPLVMIYWIPPTCNNEGRMLYAGAVELVRDKAGVSKYV